MIKGRKTIWYVLMLLSLMYEAAHGDIYQYVDEHGVVHFTNINGGAKNHKKVKQKPDRAAEGPAPARRAPASQPQKISSLNIPGAYLEIINTACEKYGVDPSLVHALIKVESDFNPFALSRKGAMGLMQLMPQTAVDLNVKNSFSPHENIDGGVKYLRYLMDRYEGNLSLALAAYNSGETAVKRWGTVPPFRETRQYVKKVLQHYNGTGKTFTPRYTIYVGFGADGTLLLTDNPSNHPGKKLRHKMDRNL